MEFRLAPGVRSIDSALGNAHANYANIQNMGNPFAENFSNENLQQISTGSLHATVNKLAAPAFRGFLNDLSQAGYNIKDVQGFNPRTIAGSSRLSQHAWGNAIDINPLENPNSPFKGAQATTNLPDNVNELAAKWGLVWGGNFKSNPDPMHFEWMGPQGTETASVPSPNEDVGTIGLKNNNPGNLKFFAQNTGKYEGDLGPSKQTDQGDPQIVFKSPEAGTKAIVQLSLQKYGEGMDTVNKIIAGPKGWTGGSKAKPAAAAIATRMGISPDDKIDLKDPKVLNSFLKNLVLQENGVEGLNNYTKLIDQETNTQQASNDLPGGAGNDQLQAFSEGAGVFNQSIVYKDHLEEAGKQGPGTFDANKLPDGEDYPTEDRRGEVLTKEERNQRFIDAQLKARNDAVWRHIAGTFISPNDITGIDAALKAFEANPQKYLEENSIPPDEFDQYLIDRMNRGTLLQKSDKGDFKQKRK